MNRKSGETDEKYIERLTNLPDFNKTTFKRHLLKDCLLSLESIKHLNNEHVNKVTVLIKKWLKDETSVTEEEFVVSPNANMFYADWIAFQVCISVVHTVTCANSAASWAARAASYASAWAATSAWEETRQNKFKQYLRFAKKLVFKPDFPQNFVNYLSNSQTEEELNVWIIDYAQEHDLYPKVQEYIEFLYETSYKSSLILGNEELKHLLN